MPVALETGGDTFGVMKTFTGAYGAYKKEKQSNVLTSLIRYY